MNKISKISGMKILAVVVIVFISLTAVTNANIFVDALKTTKEQSGDVNQLIDNVKNSYTSQIKHKNFYLNLNGLFAKYTGRTVYNEVSTLKNGMLTYEILPSVDVEKPVEKITEFGLYAESLGREFVFVQAPYKMDMENQLLPLGAKNDIDTIADIVTDSLQENGIDVLDLRPYLAATPEQIEKYFYRTDHHWNNFGAFEAFGKIVEKAQSVFPEAEIDSSYAKSENWKKTTYEDWFLGSHGKRVGVCYGGVDDYVLFEPLFNNDMTFYVTNHMQFYKGDFREVNIREGYLDEPNYFEENPYCTYIGGDYPIVKHRNKSVENDLKVLIIKDSYSLPVQAFLSTVFAEVEVLDPRHYTGSSVAEYIELYDPDLIMLMVNPSILFDESYYTFGIDKAEAIRNSEKEILVLNETDVEIEENTSMHNHIPVIKELSPSTKYTFCVEDVEIIIGKQDGVTMAIYDAVTNTICASSVIDFDLLKNENYEWTFVTPALDGDLQLLLYSGINGNAQNTSVVYKNVSIKKYE